MFACALAWADGVGTRPFLWQVDGGQAQIALFGSLHVGRPDFYPLPPPVEQAFDRADVLAVEIDSTALQSKPALVARMLYEPPDNLEQHVSPETWSRVVELARSTPLGVDGLRRLKPMTLSTLLTMAAFARGGYTPDAGVDIRFIRRAREEGKAIVELESAEMQIDLLDELSRDIGGTLIDETIDGVRSGQILHGLDGMVSAWKAGDAAALDRMLREANSQPGAARMYRRVFDDRNVALATRIAELAAGSRNVLVVVGAGHFPGANGIVELLRAKGLGVRQVE